MITNPTPFTMADLERLANQPAGESAAQSDIGTNAKPKDNRYRLQFKFWLNARNDDDDDLAIALETLKTTKQYTQTIRDGVRLVMDLKAGRTKVLKELFPWVLESR